MLWSHGIWKIAITFFLFIKKHFMKAELYRISIATFWWLTFYVNFFMNVKFFDWKILVLSIRGHADESICSKLNLRISLMALFLRTSCSRAGRVYYRKIEVWMMFHDAHGLKNSDSWGPIFNVKTFLVRQLNPSIIQFHLSISIME